MTFKIAISGIGTSVGLGIIKSIRSDCLDHFILGIDNQLTAHSYMVDKFEYMEKVENLKNNERIVNLLNKFKIDVLLIASEYEIQWFSLNKIDIEKKSNTKICIALIDWIKLGNNKLKTYKFLNKIGVSVTSFFYYKSKEDNWISCVNSKPLIENDFPLFLKPNMGTSNKGIIKFDNLDDFNKFTFPLQKSHYVLQKSLCNINSFEVTSSIVISKSGEIEFEPFHAKRKLNKGISWEVEKINSPKLDEIVLLIGKNMKDYFGSLNIQFMGSEDIGFYPLEINTRFSSTTSYRLACKRNEVMYLINDLMDKNNSKYIGLKLDKYPIMHRYVEDYLAY